MAPDPAVVPDPHELDEQRKLFSLADQRVDELGIHPEVPAGGLRIHVLSPVADDRTQSRDLFQAGQKRRRLITPSVMPSLKNSASRGPRRFEGRRR